MDYCRYIDRVTPVLRGRALAAGSLIEFSLLSCTTGCHAEQGRRSQARGSTIPALDALPHSPLPRGDFEGWCGLNDKILMRADNTLEAFGDGLKSSTLFVPSWARGQCSDDGRRLAFVDSREGRVSEVDVPSVTVTRTLATYEKQLPQEISLSPDLKSVASRQPLTLAFSAVNFKVIQLSGSVGQAIGHVRWSRDSSEFFVLSNPRGQQHSGIVDIFNTQHQKIGSGANPAGFLFREGWFANSQALYRRMLIE